MKKIKDFFDSRIANAVYLVLTLQVIGYTLFTVVPRMVSAANDLAVISAMPVALIAVVVGWQAVVYFGRKVGNQKSKENV